MSNKLEANTLLITSDTAMHRIAEAVALGLNSWTNADVVAWVDWRRAIRVIADGSGDDAIPPQPPYPAGT